MIWESLYPILGSIRPHGLDRLFRLNDHCLPEGKSGRHHEYRGWLRKPWPRAVRGDIPRKCDRGRCPAGPESARRASSSVAPGFDGRSIQDFHLQATEHVRHTTTSLRDNVGTTREAMPDVMAAHQNRHRFVFTHHEGRAQRRIVFAATPDRDVKWKEPVRRSVEMRRRCLSPIPDARPHRADSSKRGG